MDSSVNILQEKPMAGADYYGDDGLLHCGICHEAKEKRYPEDARLLLGSDKHPRHCACMRSRNEKEEHEFQKRQHRQTVERLRRSCFTDRLPYDMTFEAASTIPSGQLDICRKYTDNWDKDTGKNKGLLLWGDVGKGKSYMAVCIANALLEKEVSVRMLNFGKILNASFDEKACILEDIPKYDLLILDDFGMERNTEYGLEIVFQVIDSRYQCRKPMIITTNLSLETLKSPTDLDHERIYSRILEVCVPVLCDGENLREQARKKNIVDFRKLIS